MLDATQVQRAATNIRQLGDYLCKEADGELRILEVGVALTALSIELRDTGKDAA